MKNQKLFAVASGSGGHIIPALIAAQQWHKKHLQGTVIFCTGTADLDKKILAGYPFITSTISFSINKFNPKCFLFIPLIFMQIAWAFIKSFFLIIYHQPTTIISTGGLIALPLCYVGRLMRSHIEVYELNVIPGKAVKALLPVAHIIYTPFEKTKENCTFLGKNFSYKCVHCNYPIRFSEQDKTVDKKEIISQINQKIAIPFNLNRKTLFIIGGSQGSLLLNNAVKNVILFAPEMHQRIQIIHQTGSLDPFDWKKFYMTKNIPALTFSYLENIKQFYLLADLIIGRAGAGTLFEIEFFKKHCFVVPLVSASTNHQVANAQAMVKKYPNLFTLVDQQTIQSNTKKLTQLIMDQLFTQPGPATAPLQSQR